MQNESEISHLYKKYYHDLKRFLKKMLKDDLDVEDLVQDTFIKVNKSVNWNSIKKPKAYLIHVAQNLAIDKIRRTKREKEFIHSSELEVGSDLADPQRTALTRERIMVLTNAISNLSPSVQQAFILNKIYNLSYKEIAATMSLSVKTVEKHIAKGLLICVKKSKRNENEDRTDNIVTIVSYQKNMDQG
jgi:RNA polymerase sigma factor (sigma-70 family)